MTADPSVVPSLRLLADDLTGALDTAAEFVGLCGPLEDRWADGLAAITPKSLAIDSGTRECTRARAIEIVQGSRRCCGHHCPIRKLIACCGALGRANSPCSLDSASGVIASSRPPSRTRAAKRDAEDNSSKCRTVHGVPPVAISRPSCALRISRRPRHPGFCGQGPVIVCRSAGARSGI